MTFCVKVLREVFSFCIYFSKLTRQGVDVWLVLLLDDDRIADIILLMLLTQGQGHGLRNGAGRGYS